MKKFKAGDKVKHTGLLSQISFYDGLKYGGIYTVLEVSNFSGDILLKEEGWYHTTNKFTLVTTHHPLKIKKITRTRKGIEYHTWQLSKNGKVINHNYNSKQSRDKQLNKFIEDIKSGNFEIL